MKVAILGASGFVGRNILDCLEGEFEVMAFGRKITSLNTARIFDYSDSSTWDNLFLYNPDIVINAAAYGVVKTQKDLATMYDTNYFHTIEFYKEMKKKLKSIFWFQIGTAFEYDLNAGEIDEQTVCQPMTHYGISKLMCSNYFQNNVSSEQFTILRPFGMFGKYEDLTKIFPALLNAQANNEEINLSAGKQRRDYLYVQDLANFIKHLLKKEALSSLPDVINVGSGELRSLLSISEDMASQIDGFNPELWRWGKLDFRSGESDYFFNSSKLAMELGLQVSNHKKAFKNILPFYIK